MSYPQDSEKINNKYADFLRNKKVILVGPAPHMRGWKQGELIDSYDIVVRVSKGYELIDGLKSKVADHESKGYNGNFSIKEDIKEDFGTRIDILYQTLFSQWGSGFTAPFNKLKNRLKWLCASFPDKKHKPFIKDFIRYTKKLGIFFHIMNKSYWEKIVNEMDTIPTVGPTSALDLLQYDIKELYLTGFTFCQIKDKNNFYYYPEYFYNNEKHLIRQGGKKHNNKKIYKYFKNMYKNDQRITCDKILTELMESKL